MKVFVSWSGDRSKAVASALKHWLPFVFQGLDVWMSEQNIQAGAKWGTELGKALGDCKLGIICLTPESLQSRWLTFEAGALSTAIDGSRVIPYRFQLRRSDISPPLSQFQNVSADEEGTYGLVRSINDALGKPWPEEEKVRLVFQKWWSLLKEQLEAVQHIEPVQIRSDRDLLEEMLDLARQAGIRDLNTLLGQLLAAPHVLRVEVGQKQVAGTMTNCLALRIIVAKKLPLAQIPREQLIPPSIFGMPTDVVEGA
jgi:hypothetical protein